MFLPLAKQKVEMSETVLMLHVEREPVMDMTSPTRLIILATSRFILTTRPKSSTIFSSACLLRQVSSILSSL